jgi:hypothetical protein
MTEKEAAPFGDELQPFPTDHHYHFEYVCPVRHSRNRQAQPTDYHLKTGHVPQPTLPQRHPHESEPSHVRQQQRIQDEAPPPRTPRLGHWPQL